MGLLPEGLADLVVGVAVALVRRRGGRGGRLGRRRRPVAALQPRPLRVPWHRRHGTDGRYRAATSVGTTRDDQDRVAYLARLGDRPVGFALVRGLTGDRRLMGEFFVVRVRTRRRTRAGLRRARRARASGSVGDRLPGGQRQGGQVLAAAGCRGAGRHRRRSCGRDAGQAVHPAGRLAHGVDPVTIVLPDGVLEMRDRGDDWSAWVDALPRLVGDLVAEWELAVDGALMNGFCSVVVPVVTADGEPAVLKVSIDFDDESELEHLALQRWHGDGTVLLLRADPHRTGDAPGAAAPARPDHGRRRRGVRGGGRSLPADPRAGTAAAAHRDVVRRALGRRPRRPAGGRADPAPDAGAVPVPGPRLRVRPRLRRFDRPRRPAPHERAGRRTASRGW